MKAPGPAIPAACLWELRRAPEFPVRDGVAVLPLFGLGDCGLGAPLDAEELVGTALLAAAAADLGDGAAAWLRILPPQRLLAGGHAGAAFPLAATDVLDLLESLARQARDSGVPRLCIFTTSPHNEEIAETAARDAHQRHGVAAYCVHSAAVGADFHPVRRETSDTLFRLLEAAGAAPARSRLRPRPPRLLLAERPWIVTDPGRASAPRPDPAAARAALAACGARLAALLRAIRAHALPA